VPGYFVKNRRHGPTNGWLIFRFFGLLSGKRRDYWYLEKIFFGVFASGNGSSSGEAAKSLAHILLLGRLRTPRALAMGVLGDSG
jgi:hypothetical protein